MQTQFTFVLILFVFLFSNLSADGAPKAQISVPAKEHTLKNGMKVLIVEDHKYPVFAAYLQFNVGNVYEYPGITGGAHLLEHMMFKGTKIFGTRNYNAELSYLNKIEKLANEVMVEERKEINGYGKSDKRKIENLKAQIRVVQAEEKEKFIISEESSTYLVQNGGGNYNASTWEDITNYYVSLPSNRLQLWAFLMSDQIANPVFREFYSERDVVYEERRLRVDTQPDGILYETLSSLVFNASPYHTPVIGWPSDIRYINKSDMEQFFKTYYAPNNAIAIIVGDVKEAEVMLIMKKYFEPIPPQLIPDRILTKEEEQKGERRAEVEFGANPLVYIGYQAPLIGTKDYYAIKILQQVLGAGRTSRLHRALIEESQVAYDYQCLMDVKKFAAMLFIGIVPKAPKTTLDAEKVVYAEIERLKNEPVSQWELEKVKNHLEIEFIEKLESPMGLAEQLGLAYGYSGSWKNIDERAKLQRVTREDIMRVAKKYLIKSKRSVATLVARQQGQTR